LNSVSYTSESLKGGLVGGVTGGITLGLGGIVLGSSVGGKIIKI
jgi:hypothetical protein